MSGEFFLVVAVVLVLGSVWIWINVLLFGKRNSKGERTSSSAALPEASSSKANEQPSELASSDGTRDVSPTSDASFAPAKGMEISPEGRSTGTLGDGNESDRDLSVVVSGEPIHSATSRVFARPAYPFRINETIPAFDDEVWRACFYRLTEDREVLGWVAFAGEIVGASDRDYDNAFIDVLRSYQHTVEKLRKEVGLTHVSETSIVADEGKIWFFAVVDDTWIALFADHDADIHEIANRLIGPVRVQLSHDAE